MAMQTALAGCFLLAYQRSLVSKHCHADKGSSVHSRAAFQAQSSSKSLEAKTKTLPKTLIKGHVFFRAHSPTRPRASA
jgi:hypothetical protein